MSRVLRQLGDFDTLYPPGDAHAGNKQIDLLIASRALDAADDDAATLRSEMIPTNTMQLLELWEQLVAVQPEQATIGELRESVIASMRARGGLSRAYFAGIVAALGYEYGRGAMVPHAWFVEGGGEGRRYFRAGYSSAGDPVFAVGAEGAERQVIVFGTEVERDRRLQGILGALICEGVDLLFKNA